MNFLVDNNLPPAFARALNELSTHFDDGIAVEHLRDRFRADTPDVVWIEGLAPRGEWAVISADQFSKPLEKEALRRAGLIVFVLERSWSKHQYWEKAHNIVRWWPRIVEQAEGVRGGAMFKVPWNFSGKGRFEQIRL